MSNFIVTNIINKVYIRVLTFGSTGNWKSILISNKMILFFYSKNINNNLLQLIKGF